MTTQIRSGTTKKLSKLLLALALVGGGTASAQTPTGPTAPEDGSGMPAPPPDEEAAIRLPDPEPEPDPVPVPDPVPETPPMPEKVKAGKEGYFQLALLLQGWYTVDHTAADNTNAFRLRRAEIHVKGQIVPDKVAYEVHIDPAKVLEPKTTTIPTTPDPTTIKEPQSAISALQDFYITYLSTWADVSIGQFKIPVSWEGYNSSGKLLFPERAAVSKQFGDKRDLGIRVTKTFDKVMYSAGVFNGTGLNTPENNDGKEVGLRLEYYPIKGLTVAGVGYAAIGNRDDTGAKDRWEFDARYEKDALLFQGEAILARDVDAMGTAAMAHGFYAAAAYKLKNNVQPAVRIGALDPNGDVDDDQSMTGEIGVNYYFREHQAKLQGSYGVTLFADDMKDTDHLVIMSAQVSY